MHQGFLQLLFDGRILHALDVCVHTVLLCVCQKYSVSDGYKVRAFGIAEFYSEEEDEQN